MNYLSVVNHVLRRLREDEVERVRQNDYSAMVGDYVNDAKSIVETSWDWSALRESVLVSTVAGQHVYPLDGSTSKFKQMDVLNRTSRGRMRYQTQRWFNNAFLNESVVNGSPYMYTYDGTEEDGDAEVQVYPVPDGVYKLEFSGVVRSPDMENDSDKLVLPSQPVIHMAVALLARERGETGGTSTAEYYVMADRYLADAIALDAARHPEETIWYTP